MFQPRVFGYINIVKLVFPAEYNRLSIDLFEITIDSICQFLLRSHADAAKHLLRHFAEETLNHITYEEIPPLPTGTNRRVRKVARDLARGAAKRERKLRRLQWLHEHLPHRRRPIEIEDDDTLRDDFLTNAAIEAEQTVRINKEAPEA